MYFVLSMKLMERTSTVYCSAARGMVRGVKTGDVFGSLSYIVLMLGGSHFLSCQEGVLCINLFYQGFGVECVL